MFYRAGEGGKIAARRSVYTAVRLPLRCTTVCSTTPTSTHQNSALSLPPAAPDTSIDPTGHHLMLLSALLTTTAAIMSSVPKLTLTYFDFEGPTAAVRMALHMSELEWEDKRITHDEFVALKPSKCSALEYDRLFRPNYFVIIEQPKARQRTTECVLFYGALAKYIEPVHAGTARLIQRPTTNVALDGTHC